jgi:hypothetical protein
MENSFTVPIMAAAAAAAATAVVTATITNTTAAEAGTEASVASSVFHHMMDTHDLSSSSSSSMGNINSNMMSDDHSSTAAFCQGMPMIMYMDGKLLKPIETTDQDIFRNFHFVAVLATLHPVHVYFSYPGVRLCFYVCFFFFFK